jgi:hypothetical protein
MHLLALFVRHVLKAYSSTLAPGRTRILASTARVRCEQSRKKTRFEVYHTACAEERDSLGDRDSVAGAVSERLKRVGLEVSK